MMKNGVLQMSQSYPLIEWPQAIYIFIY